MKNGNFIRIGLTWISFLSYAFTGALVCVTGMIMDKIATYFHLPVSSMSNTFTFLNAGILSSIFLNAWLMEIVPLNIQLLLGFMLMILSVIGLILIHNITIFSLCMCTLGIVSGITMSIGTFLITHLYDGRRRAARLLFTDSFFSMAGIIFPIIAGVLLTKGIYWYWVYACIAILYFIIFLLSLFIPFPKLNRKPYLQKEEDNSSKEKWGIGVLFLSLAALFYILGQLSFISWVPEYATKSMGMSILSSGNLVSHFWCSYMVGMWVFSFILRFFDLQKILMVLTGLATIIMYWFISNQDPKMSYWIMMLLGFSSSAIYTTIITLGSLQTRISSPKLVNFILTCGTTGTMLTFVVTGPIVSMGGTKAALFTANGLYAMVFVMCVILGFFTKHRQHDVLITAQHNLK